MKSADQLSPSDFSKHQIWEFASDAEANLPDETCLRPVKQLPVRSLVGRLVGTELTLANGQPVQGVLGNIDLGDPVSTEHFLTVTVFNKSGKRFDLARYHDFDYSRRGPSALASFLGLPVGSIFPIQYDISAVATGKAECLCRAIPEVPAARLSKTELINLAIK